jgi:hypothetical protein
VTATQPSIEGSNERRRAYRVVVAANTVFAGDDPRIDRQRPSRHNKAKRSIAERCQPSHTRRIERATLQVVFCRSESNGVSDCGTDTILDRRIVATVVILGIEGAEAEAVQAIGTATTMPATSSRETSICRVDIDES